jgi:hypothetical protein
MKGPLTLIEKSATSLKTERQALSKHPKCLVDQLDCAHCPCYICSDLCYDCFFPKCPWISIDMMIARACLRIRSDILNIEQMVVERSARIQ